MKQNGYKSMAVILSVFLGFFCLMGSTKSYAVDSNMNRDVSNFIDAWANDNVSGMKNAASNAESRAQVQNDANHYFSALDFFEQSTAGGKKISDDATGKFIDMMGQAGETGRAFLREVQANDSMDNVTRLVQQSRMMQAQIIMNVLYSQDATQAPSDSDQKRLNDILSKAGSTGQYIRSEMEKYDTTKEAYRKKDQDDLVSYGEQLATAKRQKTDYSDSLAKASPQERAALEKPDRLKYGFTIYLTNGNERTRGEELDTIIAFYEKRVEMQKTKIAVSDSMQVALKNAQMKVIQAEAVKQAQANPYSSKAELADNAARVAEIEYSKMVTEKDKRVYEAYIKVLAGTKSPKLQAELAAYQQSIAGWDENAVRLDAMIKNLGEERKNIEALARKNQEKQQKLLQLQNFKNGLDSETTAEMNQKRGIIKNLEESLSQIKGNNPEEILQRKILQNAINQAQKEISIKDYESNVKYLQKQKELSIDWTGNDLDRELNAFNLRQGQYILASMQKLLNELSAEQKALEKQEANMQKLQTAQQPKLDEPKIPDNPPAPSMPNVPHNSDATIPESSGTMEGGQVAVTPPAPKIPGGGGDPFDGVDSFRTFHKADVGAEEQTSDESQKMERLARQTVLDKGGKVDVVNGPDGKLIEYTFKSEKGEIVTRSDITYGADGKEIDYRDDIKDSSGSVFRSENVSGIKRDKAGNEINSHRLVTIVDILTGAKTEKLTILKDGKMISEVSEVFDKAGNRKIPSESKIATDKTMEKLQLETLAVTGGHIKEEKYNAGDFTGQIQGYTYAKVDGQGNILEVRRDDIQYGKDKDGKSMVMGYAEVIKDASGEEIATLDRINIAYDAGGKEKDYQEILTVKDKSTGDMARTLAVMKDGQEISKATTALDKDGNEKSVDAKDAKDKLALAALREINKASQAQGPQSATPGSMKKIAQKKFQEGMVVLEQQFAKLDASVRDNMAKMDKIVEQGQLMRNAQKQEQSDEKGGKRPLQNALPSAMESR